MKRRCYRTQDISYANYGGRGIKVCDRWLNSFEAFLEDMGPRPVGSSLDRIDCDGNYEPGNVRWSTIKEQQNNRRNSISPHLRAEKKREWARETARRSRLKKKAVANSVSLSGAL